MFASFTASRRLQLPHYILILQALESQGVGFEYFTFQQKLEVLQTVGLTRLVSFHGEPTPIPEEQIEAVRTLVARQLHYDPHPYLVEGMRVRVTHGPLAGVEGILVLKKSVARLIIQIEL